MHLPHLNLTGPDVLQVVVQLTLIVDNLSALPYQILVVVRRGHEECVWIFLILLRVRRIVWNEFLLAAVTVVRNGSGNRQ